MKTKCCNALFELENAPIYWNNFNQVIQCHHCGEIWEPFKKLKTLQKENAKLSEALVESVDSLKGANKLLQQFDLRNKGVSQKYKHRLNQVSPILVHYKVIQKARETLKELEGGE